MSRPLNLASRQLIFAFAQQAATEAPIEADLQRISAGVEKLLLSRPNDELNENMFGALVSFALDRGLETLKNSTLLRRINARDYPGAFLEFAKFNHQEGRPLRLLTRRRTSEAALFCSFPGS